jgi:integrase
VTPNLSKGRRARGDGSVFYDQSRGVWVATIELARDPDTGRRTRRKASAPTRSAARELLDRMRAEKRKAGTVGRGDLTVGAVVAAYLAHPPADWRSPITIQVNEGHAARITAALGKVKLAALTPSRVEAMLRAMAAEGKATKTIRDTRALLRAAIRKAQRDGAVTMNAAELADVPEGKPARVGRAFTLPQGKALLDTAAGDPWWHAYIAVAILCGLRPGELLGLRWEDVDLKAGTIQMRHSLKRSELADLKTQKSRRTLDLPAVAAAALREHKRDQAAQRMRLGAAWHEMGLVFPGPDGSPCTRSRAETGFVALCAAAGLGTGWTRYATRHTFCTWLSQYAGVDIEVIADAMGHANSNVTRTVYRHALGDRISAAATAFDAILPA